MATTQVDRARGMVGNLGMKTPCLVATTTNITLSAVQTIDGVSVVAEDRVLVKDQTTASENGIYVCQAAAWIRAPDFDGERDVEQGTLVYVATGTVNARTMWMLNTADATLGTTSLSFVPVDYFTASGTNVKGGIGAGDAVTTATYDTLIGYNAGLLATTGAGNTVVGAIAGDALTVGGDNTIIGYDAGGALTTPGYHTLVGSGAGRALTTVAEITAVGYRALYASTTGVELVAVGFNALVTNTTGGYNTAVGYQANKLNLSGARNTGLGSNALRDNSTSSDNTAVGNSALLVSTGGSNTAVGSTALTANTSGVENTAVGYRALLTAITVSYNTAVGSDALKDATGANNTALGRRAGYAATSAEHSVFIGYGAVGTGITTGAYNTVVGALSAPAVTSGANNTILGGGNATALTTASRQTIVGYGNMLAKTINTATETTDSSGNVVIGNDNGALSDTGPMVIIGSQNVTFAFTGVTAQQVIIGYNNLAGLVGETVTTLPAVAIGSDIVRTATGATNYVYAYDVFIGTSAAQYYQGHAAGGQNTAIGYKALQCQNFATRQPYDNVCIGVSTLAGATTANNNVVLGNSAGAQATSAYDNIILGDHALDRLTTGNRNVVIGSDAVHTASFTGNSNVVIGNGAGIAIAAARSGCVLLGANTTTSADNMLAIDNSNTAAPLLEGDFSADWLRVNGQLALLRAAKSTSTSIGTETYVGVTTTNISLEIPSTQIAVVGRVWIIKDEAGTAAGGSAITVATEGAETIDGAATATITAAYGVLRLISNGTNLFTF